MHDALYASKIISYAQGLSLIKAASDEYDYSVNLAEMARIWKGGCIIRAQLLDKIKQAFVKNPDLPNLLFSPDFAEVVKSSQDKCRYVVRVAKEIGIPMQAFNASLDYYDALRSERLPANMIQGLRDYFGAHTYQRVDKEGVFHTEWMEVYGG